MLHNEPYNEYEETPPEVAELEGYFEDSDIELIAEEEISIKSDDARIRIGMINKALLLLWSGFIDILTIIVFIIGLGIFGIMMGWVVSALNYSVVWVWFKILGVSFFERAFSMKVRGGLVSKLGIVVKPALFLTSAGTPIPTNTILMLIIILEVELEDRHRIRRYLEVVDKFL